MEIQVDCPSCDGAVLGGARCGACGEYLHVAGEYAIGDLLAQSGSSRIHAGVRLSDGHPVAIKVLDLREASDWKSYQLFERGSELLQSLSHPGLPRVHALVRDACGNLYQVRERFEGGTLRERVERHGAPSPVIVKRMLIAMLRSLQHLLGRMPAVVHRDIKPSNVMFRRADDWQPVLIDFESVGLSVDFTPANEAMLD